MFTAREKEIKEDEWRGACDDSMKENVKKKIKKKKKYMTIKFLNEA